MEANKSKGEATMVLACLPFSEPLQTSGVWVIGFEKNAFFEGPKPPPNDILWEGSTGASLIVDDKVFKPGPHSETFQVEALQVEVVGRRALCPVSNIDPYPIAVEELHILRRLGRR